MARLIDVKAFEAILAQRHGAADGVATEPYSIFIMDSAEEMVRDEAGQPGWVGLGSPLGTGQSYAPVRARQIATLLAARAWGDSGNLQTRASGPIRETYFENGIRGLVLEQAELDWLHGRRPVQTNGLWMLRVGAGTRRRPHGVTPGGDVYAVGGEIIAGPNDLAFGDLT